MCIRDQEEVVDQTSEVIGVTGDPPQIGIGVGSEPVLERLHRGAYGRERRPEIMADGGEEKPALLLGRLEAGGHGIDRPMAIASDTPRAVPSPRASNTRFRSCSDRNMVWAARSTAIAVTRPT